MADNSEQTTFFPYCATDSIVHEDEETLPQNNLVSEEGGPAYLAVEDKVFWPNGKKLKVRFLNGSDKLKEKAKFYAQKWEEVANIDFHFIENGDADIRVGFNYQGDGRTYSEVGTKAAKFVISQNQKTMNYGSLTDNSREEDYRRAFIHEFGHALGCVHEHQANTIQWNEPKVIADCKLLYKWDENTTKSQIINRELQPLVKSDFDRNSIMCYMYPAEWTLNHESAPINTMLSDTDKAFITRIYPYRTRNAGSLTIVPAIRPADPPIALNTKIIDFAPAYDEEPRMVAGLTKIDQSNRNNIRVRIGTTSITKDSFQLGLDTWADSEMFDAGATWLEFPKEETKYQVGEMDTLRKRDLGTLPEPDTQGTRRDVQHFKFPYEVYKEAPIVIVWLKGFDFEKGANWRIRASANNITTNGFDLCIDHWGDTKLWSAMASWFSYPKGHEGVQSGRISTSDVRRWDMPIEKTIGDATFTDGFFDKGPKVYMALSELDAESSRNLRFNLTADEVDPRGFTWHADTSAGGILYALGADWVAFG